MTDSDESNDVNGGTAQAERGAEGGLPAEPVRPQPWNSLYEDWLRNGSSPAVGRFKEAVSEGALRRPTFTIHGSCVPRDSFSISGMERFCKIDAYYSFISPLVYHFDGVERPPFEDSDKWMARCHALDLDKDLGTRLRAKPSDYLVVDLADVRYRIGIMESGDVRTAVTDSRLNATYGELIAGMFPDGPSSTINPYEIPETEMESMIRPFMEAVGGSYSSERIILIVPTRAESYIGKDGERREFEDSASKSNKLIRDVSRIFVENLGITKVVDVPGTAIADEGHKWGLDRLHYTEDMYEYIADAIVAYVMEDLEEGPPSPEGASESREAGRARAIGNHAPI